MRLTDKLKKLKDKFRASNQETSLQEAERMHLGKESKLDIGLQGVFVRHFNQIAQDEEEAVDRYRETKVFGKSDPGRGARVGGDVNVPDDVYVDQSSKGGIGTGIALGLALATGLGGIGLGAMSLLSESEKQTATVTETKEPKRLRVKWWVDENGQMQHSVEEVDQ